MDSVATALNIVNGNIGAAKAALAEHGVTDPFVLDVLAALALHGDSQFFDENLHDAFGHLHSILANKPLLEY
jgi:hypothetical protein